MADGVNSVEEERFGALPETVGPLLRLIVDRDDQAYSLTYAERSLLNAHGLLFYFDSNARDACGAVIPVSLSAWGRKCAWALQHGFRRSALAAPELRRSHAQITS